jgi:hypothetical protein
MLQDSCQKEVVFESSLILYVSAAIHDGVDQLREAVLEPKYNSEDTVERKCVCGKGL